MNEKQEYAEMLDIGESTSVVKTKKAKRPLFKRRREKVDPDAVKRELIDKVNAEKPTETEAQTEIVTAGEQTAKVRSARQRKKFAVSGVGVGVFAIVALTLAIIMTNAVFPNSAINVFFRSVFGSEQKVVADTRVFSDFDVAVFYDNVSLDGGVMTIAGKGSLYSAANGEVSSLSKGEDGKYIMTIRHSDEFFTAISGMDYAYFNVGDKVYKNIPVGFADSGATVCFLDGDSTVIANYTVTDNSVVWEA